MMVTMLKKATTPKVPDPKKSPRLHLPRRDIDIGAQGMNKHGKNGKEESYRVVVSKSYHVGHRLHTIFNGKARKLMTSSTCKKQGSQHCRYLGGYFVQQPPTRYRTEIHVFLSEDRSINLGDDIFLQIAQSPNTKIEGLVL